MAPPRCPWGGGGRRWGEAGSGELWAGRVSAVVAVVVGPARRGGGVGLVVVLAERGGIIGGRVDVGLLQRRLVDVGPLVGEQVVLVQRLEQRQEERSSSTHEFWMFANIFPPNKVETTPGSSSEFKVADMEISSPTC